MFTPTGNYITVKIDTQYTVVGAPVTYRYYLSCTRRQHIITLLKPTSTPPQNFLMIISVIVVILAVYLLYRKCTTKPMELEGKTVVITGASSGIGRGNYQVVIPRRHSALFRTSEFFKRFPSDFVHVCSFNGPLGKDQRRTHCQRLYF